MKTAARVALGGRCDEVPILQISDDRLPAAVGCQGRLAADPWVEPYGFVTMSLTEIGALALTTRP